jgi:hypothetical protein
VAAGFNAFLSKPIEGARVISAVADLTGCPR